MKFIFNNAIPWAISQGILSLICTIVYNYILVDLFSVEISYIQWLGIIIISACILPTPKKAKTSNEPDAKSRIETFISSMTKKK